MGRGVKLVLFISVLFLSVQFISADPTISPSSFSVALGQNNTYTITVTNNEAAQIGGGTNPNITQIAITLPSGLSFWAGTNATSALGTFTTSGSDLIWENVSVGGYLIGGGESKTFTFTANATSAGNSNLVVDAVNSTSTITTNIALTISDSSSPVVNLVSPDNNEDDTDGVLVFECNATDNIAISSIKLSITSNGSEIYSNIVNFSAASAQREAEWDYTFSNTGTYKWNCFANDTGGSSVWGTNRTLVISTISASCSPNWDCDESDWSVCTNDIQTRICNDLNSCGNDANKPATNQSCSLLSACTSSDWTCEGGWTPTECPQNGTQTRTCTKDNACEGESGKPSQSRTCTPSGGSAWIFITIILVLILGGGAAAAFFYFRNRNPAEVMPQDNSGNQQQQNYGYSYQ